jgi:hypothetical protein
MRMFVLTFRKNTANAFSASTCFFFTCKTSNCVVKELRISVLKFSNKLPISSLVTPPLVDLCILAVVSRAWALFLDDPLELLRHKSIMSSSGSFDISPFPIRFNISNNHPSYLESNCLQNILIQIIMFRSL